MLGIISGPILYFFWKRRYGGLAKNNSEAFPTNAKTGLALGDMKRLSILFALLAVIGIVGCFFLPWYEADWTYIQYDFGVEGDYDMSLFASQGALFMGIRVVSIVCAGLAVIFGFVGKAIEPKSKKAA
jgi:hypothetical protein